MNQTQRKFLIDKIEEKAKAKRTELTNKLTKKPNLNNHLVQAIMSDNFELESIEVIKQNIRNKVLGMSDRDSLISSSWGNESSKVELKVKEIFVIPADYLKKEKEHEEKNDSIYREIASLNIEVETLVTRIQLASDSTLRKMINEVDDMGDLSLMHTKIKLLN